MNSITLDYSKVMPRINEDELKNSLDKYDSVIRKVLESTPEQSDVLGWIDVDYCANDELLQAIEQKASEIRERADVFLLIGVGGSNQGARAVIEAMKKPGCPQILYAGNNLSPVYMNSILEQMKGKSIYVNVIAKNFSTLEPGITFRVIRHYMEETYGVEEAARRTIATGSLNNSSLEQLSKMKGYTLLSFPLDIGGRFSVLSAVGLLPIAVAGVDIRQLLAGASNIEKQLKKQQDLKNPAIAYAIIRNLLLQKGYNIEMLGFFEPLLQFFSKWWVQLFGESEGKDGKGIFPTACSFSEDLHSLGQYIQDGQKIIFETFINLENLGASLKIPMEEQDIDYFNYLNGKDFSELNQTAFEATVKAHHDGGIPCMILNVPELSPYYMGQLFYFYEVACYLSAEILGVDPFDQPGVEAYKTNMFSWLGKKN